jgi:23S rRNA (guanosine2251-2'-O)-methyltransferase
VVNLTRTLQQLKASGAWVFGAAGEAAGNLFEADFSESTVLVLGSEGAGLRSLVRKQCDMLFKIPMRGQVESLNVSVAAGICLFEVYRQRTVN